GPGPEAPARERALLGDVRLQRLGLDGAGHRDQRRQLPRQGRARLAVHAARRLAGSATGAAPSLAVNPRALAAWSAAGLVIALGSGNPVQRATVLAAALAASFNLVPAVARSFTAVREAQLMRGWRPRGPGSWGELVVPVVLTTIEDSIQLAESMEARAFGSGRRTHYAISTWSRLDALII